MDDIEEKTQIQMEVETLRDLDKTRKWTMFLAILGFIGIGVMLLIGIFTGIFLSVFNKGDSASSFPGWLLTVIIISASVIYFFPLLYMYRFSKFISGVAKTKSPGELKKAFKNLRSYFTYIGILVIAVLVIYIVAIVVLGSSFTFLK